MDSLTKMPKPIKKFKLKNVALVQAIQLNLNLKEVIRYIDSGNKMAAKGDWLLFDGTKTWTVNKELFEKNYSESTTLGMYTKNPIEAEVLYSFVDTAGNKKTLNEADFQELYTEE